MEETLACATTFEGTHPKENDRKHALWRQDVCGYRPGPRPVRWCLIQQSSRGQRWHPRRCMSWRHSLAARRVPGLLSCLRSQQAPAASKQRLALANILRITASADSFVRGKYFEVGLGATLFGGLDSYPVAMPDDASVAASGMALIMSKLHSTTVRRQLHRMVRA